MCLPPNETLMNKFLDHIHIGADDDRIREQLIGIIRERLADLEGGEEFREDIHQQAITLIQSGMFTAGIEKLKLVLAADPEDKQAEEVVIRASEVLQ